MNEYILLITGLLGVIAAILLSYKTQIQDEPITKDLPKFLRRQAL